MIIFPAIDLYDSKLVRLIQGDFEKKTIYSSNPLSQADTFIENGATHLHLVDLNGARTGVSSNTDIIAQICKKNIFVELGGGIRTDQQIKSMLDIGVKRLILGTVAIENPDFLQKMVKRYGESIAVGIDEKQGKVATGGWETLTETDSYNFCEHVKNLGVKTVIYTDISKDGMLQGTNLSTYSKLSQIDGLNIIASGGISYEHEITNLKNMGIYGAILGKALYENKLNLARAIKLAKGKYVKQKNYTMFGCKGFPRC